MLLTAFVAYFFYNACVFLLPEHVSTVRPARWKTFGIAFVANYGVFCIMSALSTPLPVNWSIIAVIYALEIRLIFRLPWKESCVAALIGAAVGLAATIVMRSACAIALDVPMAMFNTDVRNLKALPVTLGFLLAALGLRLTDTPRLRRVFATIRNEDRAQTFLLVELALCFCYLCSNLLLFHTEIDELLVKLWSVKTALFVSLGVGLVVWYAYRIASTLAQVRRSESLSRELAADELLSEELRVLADHDALTDSYTRDYAERAVGERLQADEPVTLVFVDVDGLKTVNDRFGHLAGDQYLVAAASALESMRGRSGDFTARYGGDEFVVVLAEPLIPAEVAERMSVATRTLSATGSENEFPFAPSMSWGFAKAQTDDDFASLIARADEAMYRNKRRLKDARGTTLAG